MNMAKRKYSKMKKIEPAEMTLSFVTPTVPSGNVGNFYIDLSQCASLVNRRFYRQGINWAVSGIKILSGTNMSVGCRRLPNSWVLSNAWEKGFRAWQRMNNDSTEESPSIKPKFLDFKIFADAEHHKLGIGANLIPITISSSGVQNNYTRGEWESSKIVVPETTTATGAATSYELVAVGANNPGAGASGLNAKSLIEGYAASRGLPNILDPNTPDDSASYTENWQMAMFNEGTLQDNVVVDDMITENNIAPYPFENDGTNTDTQYPGGANQAPDLVTHDFDTITGTTIGSMTRMKGGNFPCGLMNFVVIPESTSGVTIQIDLVPGTHRGYLCEPMTDM